MGKRGKPESQSFPTQQPGLAVELVLRTGAGSTAGQVDSNSV